MLAEELQAGITEAKRGDLRQQIKAVRDHALTVWNDAAKKKAPADLVKSIEQAWDALDEAYKKASR